MNFMKVAQTFFLTLLLKLDKIFRSVSEVIVKQTNGAISAANDLKDRRWGVWPQNRLDSGKRSKAEGL